MFYSFVVTFDVPNHFKSVSESDVVIRNYLLRAIHNYAIEDPQTAFEDGSGPKNISAIFLPLGAQELEDAFPVKYEDGILNISRKDIIQLLKTRTALKKLGTIE